MLSCYRRDEVHDPETYSAAVGAVLADGYELAVVDYVTDPRSGLPSTQKFLPNVAEVREACQDRTESLRRLRAVPLKQQSKPIGSDAPPRPHGHYSYAEFLRYAKENKQKPRPIGAFEPGGYLGPERAMYPAQSPAATAAE